jgi:hypothetical protein
MTSHQLIEIAAIAVCGLIVLIATLTVLLLIAAETYANRRRACRPHQVAGTPPQPAPLLRLVGSANPSTNPEGPDMSPAEHARQVAAVKHALQLRPDNKRVVRVDRDTRAASTPLHLQHR